MNLIWLGRNIATSWRDRGSLPDFLRRLLWIYGPKLYGALREKEWTIGFNYAAPIGNIRLTVRTNGGADAFIHGEVFEHNYYRLPVKSAPETILDLGANIGLTAVYFGRLFPRAQLACVEPVPANQRVLEQNVQLNAVMRRLFWPRSMPKMVVR